MYESCTLCTLPCKATLVEETKPFCCVGCLTVFRILHAQGYEGSYQTHPLFKQACESGIISNPHLYEDLEDKQIDGESKTVHLEIEEMWCPSCADAISLILKRHRGIKRCVVDYATDLALIEYFPRSLSEEGLFHQIKKLGYRPRALLEEERKPARSLWMRFGVSAFCALNLMMLALPLYTSHFGVMTEGYEDAAALFSFVLALPLVTYCAWPIWRRFFVTLKSRKWGMETLVLIGILTAFGSSTAHLFTNERSTLYFDSMSMLLTFVLLGKILERRAKFSAKESLFRITRTLPKKGRKRLSTGEFVTVPIKEIQKGDVIAVRMGEKVILDGCVVGGEGVIDASIMTGEARPLRVKVGSKIVGGALLKQGTLQIEVSSSVEEALLTKVTAVIEQDMGHKTKRSRLIDRLMPFFVPSVLVLAACVYPIGGVFRSLAVLLISCPCAIGIAVPLAEARLLFRFAEVGALVRNRQALSILAQNPFFAFDKTGTLTEGKFTILTPFELTPFHQRVLKGLSEQTTHPVAVAIGEYLSESVTLESVKEIVGRGMEGVLDGKTFRLGSITFMEEQGIKAPVGRGTVVHFAEERTLLATIELGDRLRSGIPAVEGVVLSGDSPALVEQIAKQCGFKWGKGGLDPLQKRAEIEKLPKPVVMVGDGVNDAPALSKADVGISVVSATDMCIEVSDILLTKESLSALPKLIELAKKGERIIWQNLFWAFIYNIVGIGLAASGLLTPFFAILAMTLSSLCVTLNSLRN